MISYHKKWKSLFLFCLGLAAGTSFCMKWMEPDLFSGGEQFSIMGLELFYSKEKIITLMAALDEHTRTILLYHLHFDYAFMAGIFPGIAALCMMAAARAGSRTRRLLVSLAAFQTVAWGLDLFENYWLIRWTKGQVPGDEFVYYHSLVIIKWVIALTGVISAILVLLIKRKRLYRS